MTETARFVELGSALRLAREVAGLTQMEAAAKMGTTATQLSRYESGRRQAPLDFIQRAERVYEQIITPRLAAGVVSRETERLKGSPSGPGAHHRRVMLDAAVKLSALAAELIREANDIAGDRTA